MDGDSVNAASATLGLELDTCKDAVITFRTISGVKPVQFFETWNAKDADIYFYRSGCLSAENCNKKFTPYVNGVNQN
jgi:hypothetical protein